MEDNHNLLAPASPELGTAQPLLVFFFDQVFLYHATSVTLNTKEKMKTFCMSLKMILLFESNGEDQIHNYYLFMLDPLIFPVL